MKPYDECWECGFWLEDENCCEHSLTNNDCPILNIEIDKFYEEELIDDLEDDY